MEVYHCLVDSPINRKQDDLLKAARQALVTTSGWPTGVVLDKSDAAPKSTKEGIRAEVRADGLFTTYDYWVLTMHGDFYTLMSLFEDDRQQEAIFLESRIRRTTDALLHCVNLYRALGAESTATVEFRISYGGLQGRELKSSGPRSIFEKLVNDQEDSLDLQTTFRLDHVEARMRELVVELCSPLFILFNFFKLSQNDYFQLVDDYIAGKIR
jgi:hypothetical protein